MRDDTNVSGTKYANLFEPLKINEIELPNRVLMAPLTRNRSHSDGTPKEWAQTYYGQRASAGLIITEATQISEMGKGYLDTPGIHTEKHAEEWAKIVDAVHANGGRIFLQLWHVGRISHTSLLPDGASPHAPSAITAESQTYTANGFEPTSQPVAMTKDQIAETVEDYGRAAEFAVKAGFDGVEVHAANGYLLDQFLQDGSNERADEYGGSVENRMRFLTEVLDRVTEVIPASRVGIRLSPLGQANDIHDSDPENIFGAVIDMLDPRGLAYLHFVEDFSGKATDEQQQMLERLASRFSGAFFGNGGYDAAKASQRIADGKVDAVTFGKKFIANPDLPERFRLGAELNEPDQSTFYGGDEHGYTDYPALDD